MMITGGKMKVAAAASAAATAFLWVFPASADLTEEQLEAMVARVQAAQEEEVDAADDALADDIEEVVVTGRFISSSQQLVNERMNDAFATDLLGAEAISRLGD